MANKDREIEIELFPIVEKAQVKHPDRINVIHVYHHRKKRLTTDQKWMIFCWCGLGTFCITLAVIFLSQVIA